MEHLVLGLVLLSGTLAAGNPLQWQNLGPIKKIRLDMAPTSFDDQYRGCSPKMYKDLEKLHQMELTNNSIYAEYWPLADAEWKKRAGYVHKPPEMRTKHAVALLAYTHNGTLHGNFNTAVREAGRSREEYLEKFHFKTLHFLLTQALRILWEAQPPQCYQVYRGVSDIRFTAQRQDCIRFGQFASTSFLKSVAEGFGKGTFFSVTTCYGVPIRRFSFFPDENEVLIPPYERFVVTSITKHWKRTEIQLESAGTCSNYNCLWVKEKRCKDQPCDFSAGRTIVEDLPAPLGALPGRHGTGRHGGTLSPNATDATAPRRRVQDGSRHCHRDGGMGRDSLWG